MSKGGKAEQLLGLKGGPGANSGLLVQLQGCMQMRVSAGNWKKRFCVIKDGFLIWYKTPPADVNVPKLVLDKKPFGILPLAKASIQRSDHRISQHQIYIEEPFIVHSELSLNAATEQEANEWYAALLQAKKATWKNAKIGIESIKERRRADEALEADKTAAVKQLEEKAAKLEKVNRAKERLEKKEREQMEKFERQLEDKQADLDAKKNEEKDIERKVEQGQEEIEKLSAQRKNLETKLAMANLALRNLEREFKGYIDSSATPQSMKAVARQSFQRALSKSSVISRTPRHQFRSVRTVSTRTQDTENRMKCRLSKVSEIDPSAPPPPLPPLPPKVSQESLQQSVLTLRAFFDTLAGKGDSRTSRARSMNSHA